MPMIPTGCNHVIVGRPSATDTVVAVFLPSPRGRWRSSVRPIAEIDEAVKWALSMSEYMAGPIEVIPFESEEALDYAHFAADAHQFAFAGHTPEVRAQGHDILKNLDSWENIRARRQR